GWFPKHTQAGLFAAARLSAYGTKRTYHHVCCGHGSAMTRRLLFTRSGHWTKGASLHQRALVPTFAAPAYDGLQYGSLSLRANQRLQTCRAEHLYRRRPIRIFDRRRSKAAASVYNPNDSGPPFKRRPLPSFADQVRREAGQRAARTRGDSSSRVA